MFRMLLYLQMIAGRFRKKNCKLQYNYESLLAEELIYLDNQELNMLQNEQWIKNHPSPFKDIPDTFRDHYIFCKKLSSFVNIRPFSVAT